MPLDPAVASLLAAIEAEGNPPLHEVSVADAREAIDALADLGGEGADVADQVEREIGGVPAVVYTPHRSDGGAGPLPVLVWMHGGGWVIGAPRHYHSVCRDLAAAVGCVVVSLDYRLAPEHKAPIAVDDCATAVEWVLDHGDELGGDRDRVAVGGDSAGGNLAALMAQRFPDRLAFQLLVYPATDLSMSAPSIDENGEGYLLTKVDMEWFIGHYLDDSGVSATDPAVSPMYAPEDVLGAVPPGLVITAEFDPLRDEGEAYAARLQALGVAVTAKRYDGMIHGFYGMQLAVPASVEAIADSAEHVGRAFAA